MVGVGRWTDKRMGQGEWRGGGGDAILLAKRVLNGGRVCPSTPGHLPGSGGRPAALHMPPWLWG